MHKRACETCGAPADWGVADMQEAQIERVDGQLLTLLAVKEVHWWCDAHTRVGFRFTRFGERVCMR